MEFNNMTTEELTAHFEGKEKNEPSQETSQISPNGVATEKVEGPDKEEEQKEETEPETNEQESQLSEELSKFFDEFDKKLFKENVLLPFNTEDGKDYVVPKSLDDIVALVQANKEKWVEEARNQDKEALLQEVFQQTTPAFRFIAENANQFNSPEELVPLIQSVQTQDFIANIDVSTPEGQEQVVRMSLQIRGLDPSSIEDEIQDLKDREKLESRANVLKPQLDKYQQDRTAAILEEQNLKNQQDQIFWNNYFGKLNEDFLNAQEVDGMNFTRDHKAVIAQLLIPDSQTGGLPIYSYIDDAVSKGNINLLAKVSLILQDNALFDTYYGSKKATETARGIQRTLRTRMTSNTTQEVADTKAPKVQNKDSVGYGVFLK